MMRQRPQIIRIRAITLALCLVGPPAVVGSGFSDRIAAVVNNEIITLSEIRAELQDEVKRLRARFRGRALKRRLLEKEHEALNSLIEHKLQLQAAESKGVRVTEEEIQQALNDLQGRGGGRDSSEQALKKRIREELLLMRLLEFEVRQHVMVSEEDLHRYYEKEKDRFLLPPEYRLRQILFLPKSGETRTEVKTRAEVVHDLLKDGEDFSELAQVYSDAPEAQRGGELGYLRQEELLAPLRSALKSLRQGEISPPIETTLGVHIIALDKIKSSEASSFEEVREDIKKFLYQQKSQEAYQVWMAGLKEKAYIEVKF